MDFRILGPLEVRDRGRLIELHRAKHRALLTVREFGIAAQARTARRRRPRCIRDSTSSEGSLGDLVGLGVQPSLQRPLS
jgi:hypothetical protein